MKRLIMLSVLFALATLAHADTLTFVSTGGVVDPSDTYYVYPYNFSINGSTALTPLMCISFQQEIYQGESWAVNVLPLTTATELEAAWLLRDAQANPANDVNDQLAAWWLFDNAAPMDAGAEEQLTLAEAGYKNINPANFVIYSPIDGTQSTGELPQTFIGYDMPALAPEPTCLLLFGTGLLAIPAGRKLWMLKRK